MAEEQIAEQIPTATPAPAEDWPAKASSTVVQYVGVVRDKTTGPALVASRNAVYLLAIALIAVVFLILLLSAAPGCGGRKSSSPGLDR